MGSGVGNKGQTQILWWIGAVVALVVTIVIVIMVYGGVSRSVSGTVTLAGSANILGTQGLTITMTASGGKAVVTQLNIFDPNGNLLLKLPGGTTPNGCTTTIYNATGSYTSWGTQVVSAGQSVTINLAGTCGLASASSVQVVYNNGKTTMIPVSS